QHLALTLGDDDGVAEFQKPRIFFRDRFLAGRFGVEGDGGVLDIVAIDGGDRGDIGPGKGAEGKIGHGCAAKKRTAAFVSCGPIFRPTKFLDFSIKEAADYSRLPKRRRSIMNRLMKSR